MKFPRLEIDLNKIQHNTEIITRECHKRGISVAGVTKLFSGDKRIAKALVDGGVDWIADSRVENLKRFKDFDLPKMLLRQPMLSQSSMVVKYADVSLVSEQVVVKKLDKVAQKQGKLLNVILMIESGDLREGIFFKDEIDEAVKDILSMDNVRLLGIGTNFNCFGGVKPTREKLMNLIEIRNEIQTEFGVSIEIISGGNSGTLGLFKYDAIPLGINQLRLGASLSLGIGLDDIGIEDLHNDAFILATEIVERRNKPSVPIGDIGANSSGKQVNFVDKGIRARVNCAIGRQDIQPEEMEPIDPDIEILGASSDHLILDVTDSPIYYKVGDKIRFRISYRGCLSCMTSSYVGKKFF